MMRAAVLTQSTRVTDRQTDEIGVAYAMLSRVKTRQGYNTQRKGDTMVQKAKEEKNKSHVSGKSRNYKLL